METAKLAKRDVSVEAIHQLYNAKELDGNLLPVVGDDGGEDEEDSELQDEKRIVDAGTIRRKQKYKVQVRWKFYGNQKHHSVCKLISNSVIVTYYYWFP